MNTVDDVESESNDAEPYTDFLFMWDCNGIEAIVCIDQYREAEKQRLFEILGDIPEANSLSRQFSNMLKMMTMRAHMNSQRFYEIYTVRCSIEMDEAFWQEQWNEFPQETANLVRSRGHRIMGHPMGQERVLIR